MQAAVAGVELVGDEGELPMQDVALARVAGFCLQGFQIGSDLGEGRLKILFAGLREAFEQVGDAVAALVELADEVGAVCAVHFAAVCAERGDVAGQGIAGFEEVEAALQVVAVFFGFAAHVGEGAAEGGGALVGLAADGAVFDVVGDAVLELVEDFSEVGAVAGDGLGGGFFEGEVTPVRPEVGDGRPGEDGADDGVDDADGHGGIDVQPGEGEAGEGLDGDEEGGEAVFVASGHEEQGGAGDDNPELGFNGRGEVGDERTDNHAENRTGNALVHAAFGGGVVGLADENGGQEYPVAEVEMEDFDDDAGGGNEDGEARGMTENARLEVELAADGLPDVFQAAVFEGGDAGVADVVVFGGGVAVLELAKLVVNAAEVVEQAADVEDVAAFGVVVGVVREGLAAAFHRASEAFAVCVVFAVPQGGGNVAARLSLHFEQAADAEDEVGVFKGIGQLGVVGVGGADAFVYVLGGEVIAQHFGSARVAVFAAQAVKQGGAALVEGSDDAGVAHGEVDLAVAEPGGFVGIEKVGFGVKIAAECFVGVGDAFLDGAVREDDLENECAGAV